MQGDDFDARQDPALDSVGAILWRRGKWNPFSQRKDISYKKNFFLYSFINLDGLAAKSRSWFLKHLWRPRLFLYLGRNGNFSIYNNLRQITYIFDISIYRVGRIGIKYSYIYLLFLRIMICNFKYQR